MILADRGFDTAKSVGLKQASLHFQTFTRGKQLLALEIDIMCVHACTCCYQFSLKYIWLWPSMG